MLVFIHINKTAGRTVRYMLRGTFGLRHCEVEPWGHAGEDTPFTNEDLQRTRKLYPELESIAGHRVRGNIDLHDNGIEFKYFAIMRDPIKTCASRFQYNVQYRKKKDLRFEEWIQRDWTRNHQTKMIAGVANAGDAIRIIQTKNIFVGLTERFDESMVLLKSLVANNLDISYKRISVASSNTIAENLLSNETTRQMLIEANQADQELYNFVRDELFSSYRREYGPNLQEDVKRYQQNQSHNFNYWNLNLSRLKQFILYKPSLQLYRRGVVFA
jgi:hypothetical protein